MGIQERLRALPLLKLEALAKKAGVEAYDEGPEMVARRVWGGLCALSRKDLGALEGKALVQDHNEKKAYFIDQLISKGFPEHGETDDLLVARPVSLDRHTGKA